MDLSMIQPLLRLWVIIYYIILLYADFLFKKGHFLRKVPNKSIFDTKRIY